MKADVIVIGRLEDIHATVRERVTNYTATLRIERAIVGQQTSSTLPLQWFAGPELCDGSWYLETLEGKQAVWLLQKDETGRLYWWHPSQIWFYEPVLRRYPTVSEALTELKTEKDVSSEPSVRAVLRAIDQP